MVWVSPELAAQLLEVHVCDTYFPDHAIVYGKFAALGAFEKIPTWFKPHPLPWSELPDDLPGDMEPAKDMTVPQIFQAMETQVDAHLRQQGKPGLLRSQRGRCTVVQPKMLRHPITPVKPSRKSEYQIEFHGESFQHTLWCRQLRRLQSFVKLMRTDKSTQGVHKHREDLWSAIRGASGFPGGFPKTWLHRVHVLPESPVHLPKHVPTLAQAEVIFQSFKLDFAALEKSLNRHRRQVAKDRRKSNPNVIYADVARTRGLPVQTIVTHRHAVVTEIADDGLSVRYEPPTLQCDQEIFSQQGWLLTVKHEPGRIELAHESNLEVGDQISQQAMEARKRQVFRAFFDLWDPLWNKHRNSEPSQWEPFVSKLKDSCPQPAEPCILEPISLEQWRAAVIGKKPTTSTGPDGVSREDLMRMPTTLQELLVSAVNKLDQGIASWDPSILSGHITAIEKHSAPTGPQDFRPITVLSLCYRVWATIRAKQILAWLDIWAPSGLRGNRPQHSTQAIWWQLAHDMETAVHSGSGLSGYVTDVRKCCNTLPRPVVFACAVHFGVPLGFVRAWHDAISGIQRHFLVEGACSPGIFACTGYPEGDPLSVAGMALLNAAMHYMAEDRKQLVSLGRKVCHHATDLGGHLNYTRRFTNYTVRARIAKLKTFWDQLSRSPAPQEQKLRAVTTVAWPRCLHAIAGVALGNDHLGKLRSAVMAAMRWNKKGASPILQSLLLSERCDPAFFTFWETLSMLRNNCVPEQTFPVLSALVQHPPRHFDPGPLGVFLARIHQLNWQWEYDGFILDHEHIRWHILDSPIQLLRTRLKHAWTIMMGSLISDRSEFQGMQMVDCTTSRCTQSDFALDGAGLLRTAMNGTFYTRNKQIHAGKVPSKVCPHCDMEDSVQHRIFECEGFTDLRALVKPTTWSFLEQQPLCTRLHGWFVEDVVDRDFRTSLMTIPDTTGVFEHVPALPSTLHLFVDGSCLEPQNPRLRLATWGVTVALLPETAFAPVALGGVPGLYQTILRAELCATIAAVRFALVHKRPFWIWTDNQLVYRRVREFAHAKPPKQSKNDHDLWTPLFRLMRTACRLDLFQHVVKVASHQRLTLMGVVDRWAVEGNDSADRAAARARQGLPAQVLTTWHLLRHALTQRETACRDFHKMLVLFGLRCVETKTDQAERDEQTWEALPKSFEGSETDISLVGLPGVIPELPPHTLGECLAPLHAWLLQLLSGPNLQPLWLSSYQLFAHFQWTTAGMGFRYLAKEKRWELADGYVHEEGFNFIRLSAWLQAIIKVFAKLLGLRCEAQPKLPYGTTIRSWQRQVRRPRGFPSRVRAECGIGEVNLNKLTPLESFETLDDQVEPEEQDERAFRLLSLGDYQAALARYMTAYVESRVHYAMSLESDSVPVMVKRGNGFCVAEPKKDGAQVTQLLDGCTAGLGAFLSKEELSGSWTLPPKELGEFQAKLCLRLAQCYLHFPGQVSQAFPRISEAIALRQALTLQSSWWPCCHSRLQVMGLAKLFVGVILACTFGASASDYETSAMVLALAVLLGGAYLGLQLRCFLQSKWRSKKIQDLMLMARLAVRRGEIQVAKRLLGDAASMLSVPRCARTVKHWRSKRTNSGISWAPATECGDSSNWSITPDLPAGLALDPSSGKITGAASEISDAKTYEISASNSGGKATTSLVLEVKAGRPKAPVYAVPEGGVFLLHVGEAFELSPEDDSCGVEVTFTVSPSLPSGLRLDEVTGCISGTPTEDAEATDYEVTASNVSGSEATTLCLCVRPEKPHDLRYPDLAETYQMGQEISLAPEVQGAVNRFEVAPDLPEGLTLDATTGEIHGTLAAVSDSLHQVTATGEEGTTTAELKFTVVVSAPSNFSYPLTSPSYAVGEPMALDAEIEGTDCRFTVEPALPEGLTLDPETGNISGTPEAQCSETTYTLSASNASGSTSTSITFQVEEVQTVDAEGIDQNFAEMLEAIEDLADMVEEPSKVKSYGDWMIWMVHRAHLNDPTLTDFNFNNLHMPPAHLEDLVAGFQHLLSETLRRHIDLQMQGDQMKSTDVTSHLMMMQQQLQDLQTLMEQRFEELPSKLMTLTMRLPPPSWTEPKAALGAWSFCTSCELVGEEVPEEFPEQRLTTFSRTRADFWIDSGAWDALRANVIQSHGPRSIYRQRREQSTSSNRSTTSSVRSSGSDTGRRSARRRDVSVVSHKSNASHRSHASHKSGASNASAWSTWSGWSAVTVERMRRSSLIWDATKSQRQAAKRQAERLFATRTSRFGMDGLGEGQRNERKEKGIRSLAGRIVDSAPVMYGVMLLVFVHVILLGIEVDMSASSLVQDNVPEWMSLVCVFVLEVLLKFVHLGCAAFWCGMDSGWNVFDFSIVAISVMDVILDYWSKSITNVIGGQFDMRVWRALRFIRAVRSVRIMRIFRYVAALRTLVVSIAATMASLFWTLLLLLVVFYAFAIVLTQVVVEHCRFVVVTSSNESCSTELLFYWGSVPDSMLTLFMAVAQGMDWQIALMPLFSVSPFAVFMMMLYVVITILAILNAA
eukprot:s1004_g6.t1